MKAYQSKVKELGQASKSLLDVESIEEIKEKIKVDKKKKIDM